MVTSESSLWHIITPDEHNVVAGDMLVPKPLCSAWEPHTYCSRQYNYLMESRGELLWALVKVYIHHNAHRYHHRLSLSVKTMRWVRKTGRSLAGRVLFLGCPNSFVVDASRLRGEDRACAYLAYSGPEGIPRDQVGVYRFDLVSNKVEFVEQLPRQWNVGRPTADVVREISSRVWAAVDFVYFHAICKPWRNSRDPPSLRTTTTQFLPWLLAPAEKESAHLKFRSVFSNASYRATPASPLPWKNWVCSADGTVFWYLTIENLRPSLHDPLTGEVTHRPLFPCRLNHWEKDNPCSVVYGDGSTFLYKIIRDGDMVRFQAALLKHGDTEWVIVERTFEAVRSGELYAAYHGGKIMVTTETRLWHVITPDSHNVVAGDMLIPQPLCTRQQGTYIYFSCDCRHHYNFLVESRGELLWALVQVITSNEYIDQRWSVDYKLSLSVHALEEEEPAPKKTMRWVRKDSRSLADRVLFLGWPNSFAVDASRLGGEDGACAYMAYSGRKDLPPNLVVVFRFNLVSNKAKFIDRLPREWNEGRCTWIIAQPVITPIQLNLESAHKLKFILLRQELTERRLIAQELTQQRQEHMTPITSPTRVIHIERYYGPSFRALVRNLPLTVTSSQLRVFLSKHGKVYSAEALFYKKTKRSQGTGLVTMSTIHAHIEDAVEALSTLFLHGYKLDVCLVKGERRRL
ncbi:hypothetical protein ACQ4PT_041154 [Festuca glaucescens]